MGSFIWLKLRKNNMELYYPEEPQCLEGDVIRLLKEVNKTLKSIGANHPCYAKLCDAAADVEEWLQTDDPRDMGWVGHDGLP